MLAGLVRRLRRLRPRSLDPRAQEVELLELHSPTLDLPVLSGRGLHRQRHVLASTEGLRDWLRQDRPGQGPAWEHASDAALRLLYWGLAAPRLGALGPEVAGSVRAHLAFTLDHLDTDLARPQTALQAAGLVVGGLVFPVEGAREAFSEGLSVLGRCLERQVLGDGSPAHGSSALLQRVLAASLVARRFAHADPPQGEAQPAFRSNGHGRLRHWRKDAGQIAHRQHARFRGALCARRRSHIHIQGVGSVNPKPDGLGDDQRDHDDQPELHRMAQQGRDRNRAGSCPCSRAGERPEHGSRSAFPVDGCIVHGGLTDANP